MANLNGVNTNATPSEDFSPLPVGEYKVIIEAEESKISKKGDEYLKLKVKVIDGPSKNRVLFTNLNLWNSNPTAKEIAERELAAIKVAAGLQNITDTAQLFNRPMIAKVGQRVSEEYGVQNEIKGWKSLTVAPTVGGNLKPSTPPTSSPTSSANGRSDGGYQDDPPF